MSEAPSSAADDSHGMHRVISDPDNQLMSDSPLPQKPPAVASASHPAVIDDDGDEAMEVTDVPLRLNPRRSLSSGSSLSDGSTGLIPHEVLLSRTGGISSPSRVPATAEEAAMRREETVEGVHSHVPIASSSGKPMSPGGRGLYRMDSGSSGSLRARSENSSNDWGYGWYEDVHLSEQNLAAANRSSEKKSSRKNGLVPQVPSRGEVHQELIQPKDSQGRFWKSADPCAS